MTDVVPDPPRLTDRIAFVMAVSVLAVRPLYVHDPRRLAPGLVMLLLAGTAVVVWLAGAALAGLRLRRAAAPPDCLRSSAARSPRSVEPAGAYARLPWLIDGRLTAALLVLAALVVFGIFHAEFRRPAIATGCEWLSTLLALVCVVQTARTRSAATTLLALLLATGLVVALYGIHQYFIGLDELRREYERDPQGVIWRVGGIEYGTPLQERFGRRLRTQEAFSTFALSTSLGGYSAMLLPVAAGALGWALARRGGGQPDRRRWVAAVSAGLTAVALTGSLVLAKSRGGYAAGAVAAAVFALAAAWPFLRRHRRVLAAAAAAGAVVVALGLAWRVRRAGFEGALGASMRFRGDYWLGAWQVLRRHPVWGVGLSNFGDYYPLYKKAESPETVSHPHTLVLGLWADVGLPGLVGFVGVWVALLWRRRAREAPPAAVPAPVPAGGGHGPRRPRLPLPPEAAAGSRFFTGAESLGLIAAVNVWGYVALLGLQSSTFCLIGAVIWTVAVAAFLWPMMPIERPPATGPDPWLRAGLAAGLASIFVHSLIDLDVGVPALVATAFGLGTVLLILRRGLAVRSLATPTWVPVACLVAVGAAMLYFAHGVVRPLLSGEAEYFAGRTAQVEATQAAARGDHHAGAVLLQRALGHYQAAIDFDPSNPDPHFVLARLAFDFWQSRPVGLRASAEGESQLASAFRSLATAERLHPRDAFFLREEVQMRLTAAASAATPGRRIEHLTAARRAADRLVDEIYPLYAAHRLVRARAADALADALDEAGRPDQAKRERDLALREYRLALDLNLKQRDVLQKLPREDVGLAEAAVRRLGA